MAGSPSFLPPADMASDRSPRHSHELHGSGESTPLPQHPDLCHSPPPSNSASPNLPNEYRVWSPLTATSPTYTGINEDAETCDNDADNNLHQSEEVDPSVRSVIERATKNFRSQCWKEFEPIIEDRVVVKGRCKHCDIEMAAKRGAGTSSLLTHLRRCKKRSRGLRIVQELSSTLRSH